jgi:hypothetical protein
MQRLEWDCFLSSLYTNLDFTFITRVYNFWKFNHMFSLALLALIPLSNYTCTLPISLSIQLFKSIHFTLVEHLSELGAFTWACLSIDTYVILQFWVLYDNFIYTTCYVFAHKYTMQEWVGWLRGNTYSHNLTLINNLHIKL